MKLFDLLKKYFLTEKPLTGCFVIKGNMKEITDLYSEFLKEKPYKEILSTALSKDYSSHYTIELFVFVITYQIPK